MSLVLSFPVFAAARPSGAPRPTAGATVSRRLIGGGGATALLALTLLFGFRFAGLLTPDAATLLPAAACAGLAAVNLGVLLLCVNQLRRA